MQRTVSILLLWALLALLACLPAAPALAATYSSHYAICGAWASGVGEPFDALVSNLGVTWIRTGFDWDQIETADDYYDPYGVWLQDQMFSTMTGMGINVFHNFTYTPTWLRPPGSLNSTPPSNPAKYAEYITWAVNRWKNQCHHWGFWNEPNIAPFWTGDYNWYIQNLLIPGLDAVKAADPTAKTVVGELSTSGDDVGKLRTMLRAIVAAGRKDKVDFICHHSYDGGDNYPGRIADIDNLRNMIVAEGFGDRELWITETSIESDYQGETYQANYLIGMMQGMDARPWWTKTFWWQLHEGEGGHFGLVRYPDWSLKPAYTQYQAYIAEHADNADIVSNTIPATMVANRQYYVSVAVRNSGTVTWNDPNQWKLGAVNDSDPFAGGRQQLDPGESVPPDAVKTFRFWMTAPATTGTYTTDWQMVREGVHWFGHPLVKQVVVNNGPDTTAPAAPADFTATRGDHSNVLTWTNPSDADYTGLMIRYKTTGYPTSRTDGTLLIDKSGLPGLADSQMHTGLTNEVTYYYSAFAHDPVPNYSAGVNASATPTDLTPPGPVTNFTATSALQQVNLSWQNPSSSAFHN
ncbi:MAG: NBR1-Ig-like domain-containing protein [Armatimonadota bacterium]|nr:NBR1-Ig-like domain-containing protein [Armatimonadota bacterium]